MDRSGRVSVVGCGQDATILHQKEDSLFPYGKDSLCAEKVRLGDMAIFITGYTAFQPVDRFAVL